jgi:signal transduction histidine kinase/DNA-binding response OmpR family regulator
VTQLSFLLGGGEMGERIRAFDWARHPLGPAEQWPQSLKSAVSICVGSRFPILLWWGPQLFMLYNDAYRPMLGTTKHPRALGQAGRECWPEIWHIIGPMLEESVLCRAQATWSDDQQLLLDRNGYLEECYFTFTYSPIRDESGGVGGVFCAVIETTGRVIGQRRLQLMTELASRTVGAASDAAACRVAADVIAPFSADLPFVRLYLADRECARLVAAAGEPEEAHTWPDRIAPGEERSLLDGVPEDRAVLVPLAAAGSDTPAGYMVVGISPRRAFDDDYRSFVGLVAGHIASAIADARALESERRRAAALAELDRAKTVFFSDVSHEFRTPLTLILGPIQEALRSPERVLAADSLELLHRNALRLQKLVNALLDFSRLEAGRVEASYEATDLAALTTGVASAFRSAMERAGLEFNVSCATLPRPVFVDRGLWETIVLNLLSNAFKFTLEGSVHVQVAAVGDHVELAVSDTGTGIPPEHLPHLFERFYRVKDSRARTFEGSGIGLALVQELVRMHGGSLTVESEVGRGTTFRVGIPFGSQHLPQDRVNAPLQRRSRGTMADGYVEEALRWLPALPDEPPPAPVASGYEPEPRILLVDDNADMREYVRALLEPRWHVETAGDGIQALAAVQRQVPDLVVTDIMMPALDGIGLIRALRANDRFKHVPIIILTARAGEEARIEGLNAAADDHLLKPFSARELVARVEAQLTRAWMRRIERTHHEHLLDIFRQAPVAIAILRGPDHVYDFANDPYMQLVGDRPILGKPIRCAFPELAQQDIVEVLDHVYATGRPFAAESMRVSLHRGPNGALEEGFFNLALEPSHDPRGQVSGVLVVAYDVTELANARRAAEAANRAKDEFLAMLGHELRNPLAPILTALQVMRLRGEGAERERAIIERQVKHLVHLVDDLLDVSRITRGKVQLDRQRVEMAQVAAKAIEMASPMLEQRRHRLVVDITPGECEVDGDAARLAQVVANLLTNAAKYTKPEGRVTVSLSRDREQVALSVRDTGVGIAPDMLPGIFDLFAQGRQPLDRSDGGLGLGLAIVRSLVTLHGGTVTVHSDGIGAGSEFVVRLPRATLPARHARSQVVREADSARQTWRVLVVDDNDDAAAMLAEACRACGHAALTARDALAAINLAGEFQPDVALLDIGLPVIDGYELARRFREHPELRRTRLIAVTGYGQDSDRDRSGAAGFDAHLVKPVDLDQLLDLIDALARQQRGLDEALGASASG